MNYTLEQKIEYIRRHKNSKLYWQHRIIVQLEFAWNLYTRPVVEDKEDFAKCLNEVADMVQVKLEKGEGITEEYAFQCEEKLKHLQPIAKKFSVYCAAHAHIDMNWTWRFDETVSVVLDTVKTMIRFLEEYPKFIYSHSQVMTYSIINEYAPELIPTILEYAKQGRWEILGSVWVEADKNTPCLESNVRQLHYAHKFMQKIQAANLLSPVGFEPDAFGHHALVPELFAQAGLKYYYHCRGMKETNAYRWQAPSGKELIAFREPFWYDEDTDEGMAYGCFSIYDTHGFTTSLRSYGVGNHGGGPTRKDITTIADYDTWPCFPHFEFSSYCNYFEYLEQEKENLPLVEGERNFVHTACFSSQSRIVRGNKMAEDLLVSTGASKVLDMALGTKKSADNLYYTQIENAWKKTLFCQFHDILPGSCTADSRDYALGSYQESYAFANTERTKALREFFTHVDTSYFGEAEESIGHSEGGGVGYGIAQLSIAQTGYSNGDTRVFGLYNAKQTPYKGLVELVVWDWDCEPEQLVAFDGNGNELKTQYIGEGEYWRHYYKKILVECEVPAFGYSVIYIRDAHDYSLSFRHRNSWRTNTPYIYTLENDYIKAEFDEKTFELKSLYSKTENKELCSFAGFRLYLEDNSQKADAWLMGRFFSEESFHTETSLLEYKIGELRSYLIFRIVHKSSHIIVTISLDKDQSRLDYSSRIYWSEIATDCASTYLGGAGIDWLYPSFPPSLKRTGYLPQLSFQVKPSYAYKDVLYDAVATTESRDYKGVDVYGLNYCAFLPEEEKTNSQEVFQLLYADGTAYRDNGQSLDITLLRSSPKPDPYMETGMHEISFSLACSKYNSKLDLLEKAKNTQLPAIVPCRQEKGELTPYGSLFKVTHCHLECYTPVREENGSKAFMMRLVNLEDHEIKGGIEFCFNVKKVIACSLLDEELETPFECLHNSLELTFKKSEVKNIKIVLA